MSKSIPFHVDLVGEGTTSQILLYGLIEALAFKNGYCYASSEYMADVLGLQKGTIKNNLSEIHKKGWIQVECDKANQRVAIFPLLTLRPLKTEQNANADPVENSARPSRKNDGAVTLELRDRHARMTVTSRGDNRGEKSGDIIDNNIVDKKINKKVAETATAPADNLPAGVRVSLPKPKRRPRRQDFETDLEFETAFYAFSGL